MEGKMYQVIQGEPVEVVRWGKELLPATNPLTKEIPGQGVLFLSGISYDGREI